MGRLIPAGTGMARYQNIGIQIDAPDEFLEPPDEEVGGLPLEPGATEGVGEAPGLMASGANPGEAIES